MVDNFLLIGIVTAVITAVGILAGFYWNSRLRKDKVVETRESLRADVERTANIKQKEEQTLAKEVARENKALALEVKQDMKDHVDRLIHTFKQDVELERVRTYAKMDSIDSRVAQIKIDLMDHIIDEKDERVRMQRSIDFFQTMQYGPDAKSIPPYVTGEEQTKEHKDEPEKGVFASREDTTHKDTKDSKGNTTQEVKEQKDEK